MEYIFILNECYYRASAITRIEPNTNSTRGSGFDIHVVDVPVFVRMDEADQQRAIPLISRMMLGLPLDTVSDAVIKVGNKAVVDLDLHLKATTAESK